MDDATRTCERLRPRLKGIAHRMLDSEAEAELVMQDAHLRWHEVASAEQDRVEAWLVATVTQLCLRRSPGPVENGRDTSRSRSPQPPVMDSPPATPEEKLERADDLAVSFLASLEHLPSETRTAYMLREMFAVEYDVLAQIVGKSEAECMQMVQNARAWLRGTRR